MVSFFIINYNSNDNILAITSENKILANELAIKLASLNNFLKDRGVILSRIIIK